MSRTGFWAVLLAALSVIVPVQPVAAMNAGRVLPGDPALTTLVSAQLALVDLTNADRVANGLDPLEFDTETLEIARQRAESQLGSQSLSHYDANAQLIFAHMLADANLSYGLAGENLARSSIDNAGVTQRVEQALMRSPTHRRNILERTFKRVAIGAAIDGNGQITFAEVYRD
jgi:uncharacterized protein YkwD